MKEPRKLQLSLKMSDGQELPFDINVGEEREACFALGVRKSGSSIFASIVSALAIHNDVNIVDLPARFFDQGYRYIEWNANEKLASLVWRGNIYVGFRDAPTALFGDPVFRAAKKILMVRDPRDALVSEYFSNAYSHSVPARQAGNSVIAQERSAALQSTVEDYVLERAKHFDHTVARFAPLIGDKSLLVLRYEDVILKKRDWIGQIARHFGLDAPPQLIENILGWADVSPVSEDPTAFVRRVKPGDHLEKLSADAIKKINKQLSRVWRDLGYEA